jgi:adenosylcobinamide hydrolase
MIKGITSQIIEGTGGSYAGPFLHIRSEAPLRTLNSSVWGGGYGCHRHLINRHVPKSYDCSDPAAEMEQYLAAQGIDASDACGMLTAAYVQDGGYAHSSRQWGENGIRELLEVSAWVTAGLGNTARTGDSQPLERLYPGTVNIVIVADGCLTDAAMANAIITVTEAKAAVFQDLGIIVRDTGRLATGTTTDAVLIAATGRGNRVYTYAGSATVLGHLIGRTVYEAAYETCSRYLQQYPQFALLEEDFDQT